MREEELVKATDGIVSRYINRKISTRITKFIINRNIGVSPTQVSIISFLIGVFSSFLYLMGYILFGGVFIQISSVIDGVDGELARARGLVSSLGGFTDTILDRLVNISVYIALAYHLTIIYPSNGIILLIIIMAVSGDIMVSYLHAVAQKDLGIHPARIGIPPVASRDVRLFILFLSSLLYPFDKDILLYGLLTIGILSYLYVCIKFMELIGKYQE